jgi:hypothetical protein
MTMRDSSWLQALLDDIWDSSFSDVEQQNDVRIEFGRRAKRRLGSISLDTNDPTVSVITINSLFKLEEVPEFVIEATIFHELTHYAHGFNSPLARAQAHPHAGGVMRREYAERGKLQLYMDQKRWLKAHWLDLIQRELPKSSSRRVVRRPTVDVPKPFWWIGK